MKNNEEEKEPFFLLAHDENEFDEQDVRFLNTNASNHIYRKRNMFMEPDEIVDSQVTFGDLSKVPIKEKKNLNSLKKWKPPIYL